MPETVTLFFYMLRVREVRELLGKQWGVTALQVRILCVAPNTSCVKSLAGSSPVRDAKTGTYGGRQVDRGVIAKLC